MYQFFDLTVPFNQAIDALKKIIPEGTKVSYNGLQFSQSHGRIFCLGAELKDDVARKRVVEIYQKVSKKLEKETGGMVTNAGAGK
jgi:hypothetical protein